MNVHIWTVTRNARRFLVLLLVFAGLAIGVSPATAAQPQGVAGTLPKPEPLTSPAAPAVAPAPTESPLTQAQPAADPGAPAPAEASQAQAPLAADTPASEPVCPPEYLPLVQKTTATLLAPEFTFYPVKALDPFVPFIQADAPPIRLEEGEELSPESEKPLTPLQKMTVAEIEAGLKAITWGTLGKKAVIEDSTGKGYIVGIGTPAGERNGVIMQIQKDRLVIQQQIWDRMAKKRFPQDVIVKLNKKTEEETRRR